MQSPLWHKSPEERGQQEDPGANPGTALRVPAHSAHLREVRAVVDRAAVAFGLDVKGRHQLAVAVNEAATNAIEHGRPYADGTIELRIVACQETLVCSVSDAGTFVCAPAPTDPLAENGRGLTLMARLTDRTHVSAGCGGTTVRLHKRRPPRPEDQ